MLITNKSENYQHNKIFIISTNSLYEYDNLKHCKLEIKPIKEVTFFLLNLIL